VEGDLEFDRTISAAALHEELVKMARPHANEVPHIIQSFHQAVKTGPP
jgi:hypothetical protein